MNRKTRNSTERARGIIRRRGGLIRMTDAVRAGIDRRTFYGMLDGGLLERLSRGLYRLADLPPLGNPDLIPVAAKVPEGVVCLVSALAFHGLTTQIPHEVYVALTRGAEPPRLDHPPVRVFWFTRGAFAAGIETHKVDNVPVRVYGPEKTLADCFKYRNKIGLDTAIEALRLYRRRKPLRVDELLRYAKVCRVERVMRPYLEAVL
jgi:predicted transcriptional regulator of viral defense system